MQNTEFGLQSKWGVMLRIKLVKGFNIVGDNDNDTPNEDSLLLRGTKVLKRWSCHGLGCRELCVCVPTCTGRTTLDLFRNGLMLIDSNQRCKC